MLIASMILESGGEITSKLAMVKSSRTPRHASHLVGHTTRSVGHVRTQGRQCIYAAFNKAHIRGDNIIIIIIINITSGCGLCQMNMT